MSTRSFWPPLEAAQVDYETLRAHVCEHSGLPEGLAAARFARRGLAGLIAWPSAEPVFVAELVTATRPAWTPHEDPRMAALAAGYQFLLDTAARVDSVAGLALPGGGLRSARDGWEFRRFCCEACILRAPMQTIWVSSGGRTLTAHLMATWPAGDAFTLRPGVTWRDRNCERTGTAEKQRIRGRPAPVLAGHRCARSLSFSCAA